MAAGPASRLGSVEPGDKTGLRLSPHLAPSTTSHATSLRFLIIRFWPREAAAPSVSRAALRITMDRLRNIGSNAVLADELLSS